MLLTEEFIDFSAKDGQDFKVLKLSFINDLPFPLSMPYELRIFFGVYLLVIILCGLLCRKIILEYLQTPEIKGLTLSLDRITFHQKVFVLFGFKLSFLYRFL
jgi:hypothetical protein